MRKQQPLRLILILNPRSNLGSAPSLCLTRRRTTTPAIPMFRLPLLIPLDPAVTVHSIIAQTAEHPNYFHNWSFYLAYSAHEYENERAPAPPALTSQTSSSLPRNHHQNVSSKQPLLKGVTENLQTFKITSQTQVPHSRSPSACQ